MMNTWPVPSTSPGRAPNGKLTAALPPTLRFVGRILDSHDTSEGVQYPSAIRARRVRVSVPLDVLVMGFGSAVGRYKLSRLFARFEAGEHPSWSVRSDAGREMILRPDAGWFAPPPGADVHEGVVDIDLDDRGVVYVAASNIGWAVLPPDDWSAVRQIEPNTQTNDPPGTSVRAFKSGGDYFVIVSDSVVYRVGANGQLEHANIPIPKEVQPALPPAAKQFMEGMIIPKVSTGAGYLAVYGQRWNNTGADLGLFRADGSEVPLSRFFPRYYSRNSEPGYAVPSQSGLDPVALGCDVAMFQYGGKTYLVAAAIGLCDVYEILDGVTVQPAAPQPQPSVPPPAISPINVAGSLKAGERQVFRSTCGFCQWSFGDGTAPVRATGSIGHTFMQKGSFTVTATPIAGGAVLSTTVTIN